MKKSHCLVIGSKCDINVSTLHLSGMPLLWANEMKYLGIYVIGGKYFKDDTSTMRRSFSASVNGILNKCPRASDITKLFLCKTHCLYVITYAVESLNLLSSQYKEINSWWNSVYRKIFNYNKWDSVSELIFYLERLDYKFLCNIKKCNFLKRLVKSSNLVISNFIKFYLNSKEFFLQGKLDWTLTCPEAKLSLL